jgi:hypothetical protein
MTSERFHSMNRTRSHKSLSDGDYDEDDEDDDHDGASPSGGGPLRADRLGRQERLAVACLKPKLQGPCAFRQKIRCVRNVNNEWSIQRCHSHRWVFTN